MENILPPANPLANMGDYEKTCQSFDWKEVEKAFTWHQTGHVNIAYEAIDRYAEDPIHRDRYCLSFESESTEKRITFLEMKEDSNRFANLLRKLGVQKRDRVLLFLPRCPEYYVAMIGCAKVGAIFVPLFEASMQVALRQRAIDSSPRVMVTTPKLATRVPFADLPCLERTILVGEGDILSGAAGLSWEKEMASLSPEVEIEWMDLEDPLYLIYTFSPTGNPKGALHVHRDMIGHLITAKWVLDLRLGDVVWTTADPGWVTGTVYGAFAPWLCGVESFVRSGKFDVEGWCRSIESHRVSVWYTAPTVFRRLKSRESVLKKYDLSSLRHLLTVGEPLPSELVYWARRVFKVPIHDTWWMTETGMIMIANYPSMPIKPGSIGRPFPGIEAAVIGPDGQELPPLTLGELGIKPGWPAMMKEIWRDRARYEAYFRSNSWFLSGDNAYRDDDGYFYFQGRDDDLVKIGGVVVGPSEVEEILRRHPAVEDAGMIGKADPLRGNVIKVFISLRSGFTASEELQKEIIKFLKAHFSARIVPHEVEFRPKIPRSADGQVIRRILKAWDLGLPV